MHNAPLCCHLGRRPPSRVRPLRSFILSQCTFLRADLHGRCDPLRCSGKSHGTCLSARRKIVHLFGGSRANATGNSFFSTCNFLRCPIGEFFLLSLVTHVHVCMTLLAARTLPSRSLRDARDGRWKRPREVDVEKRIGDGGREQWAIYIAGDANNSQQFQARLTTMANRFMYTSKYYFCSPPIAPCLVPW